MEIEEGSSLNRDLHEVNNVKNEVDMDSDHGWMIHVLAMALGHAIEKINELEELNDGD